MAVADATCRGHWIGGKPSRPDRLPVSVTFSPYGGVNAARKEVAVFLCLFSPMKRGQCCNKAQGRRLLASVEDKYLQYRLARGKNRERNGQKAGTTPESPEASPGQAGPALPGAPPGEGDHGIGLLRRVQVGLGSLTAIPCHPQRSPLPLGPGWIRCPLANHQPGGKEMCMFAILQPASSRRHVTLQASSRGG